MKKGQHLFITPDGKVYVDNFPRSPNDIPGRGTSSTIGRKIKGHPAYNKGKYKSPIYELPNGIKVTYENYKSTYVMCYIRSHPLFPNTKITNQDRQFIRRSRVVMTALLGRTLLSSEHVHHKNKNDKHNDHPDNLEVLCADEHNKLHKLGFRHSEETKKKIAKSMRDAHRSGRHAPVRITLRNKIGQIVETK